MIQSLITLTKIANYKQNERPLLKKKAVLLIKDALVNKSYCQHVKGHKTWHHQAKMKNRNDHHITIYCYFTIILHIMQHCLLTHNPNTLTFISLFFNNSSTPPYHTLQRSLFSNEPHNKLLYIKMTLCIFTGHMLIIQFITLNHMVDSFKRHISIVLKKSLNCLADLLVSTS